MDPGRLNFVTRSTLAIFLGFAIGYGGYPSLGLAPYSGAIASTVSLLLSKSPGSALLKNLQRVQGVVLGTVVGQLVRGVFITCNWYNAYSIAVILFIWVSFNLFVYYNSVSYAMIGCLLAAFGAQKMMEVCQDVPAPADVPS